MAFSGPRGPVVRQIVAPCIERKWISQSDAARIRGVSPQAISDLVQKGRFRILRIGGKTFLDRGEVQNYKTKRTGRPRK